MTNIFHTARKLRRKLLKQLEGQQQDDSRVVGELRNSFVAINREILQQVSALLETYHADRDQDPGQSDLFARIAPSEDFETWIALGKQEMDLANRLVFSKNEFETTNQTYKKQAPLGPLSKFMKEDSEKKVIEALKADRARAAAKVQNTEQELAALREQIRPRAEAIFRSAMSQDGLLALQTIPSPIMLEIQRLVARLRDEPTALWTKHTEAQKQSLHEISQIISRLSDLYENQNFTSVQTRPRS
jgi:hypothetical protein